MKASDILSFNDLKTSEVVVEDWDCTLHIRELGLEEGLRLFSMVSSSEVGDMLKADDIAQVIVWGVIDPKSGKQLFSDEDVPTLAKKSRRPLMKLYGAITDLSGEDAEKN
jgi:hypothetical protein